MVVEGDNGLGHGGTVGVAVGVWHGSRHCGSGGGGSSAGVCGGVQDHKTSQ